MPQCCKAQEFGGWCSDQNIVYTEETTGDSYCLFHAPKGKKGISLEGFNAEVYKRIDEITEKQKKDPELLCDFSVTIFEGDIDFLKYDENRPLRNIKFDYAHFEGEANFWHTQFKGKANFWNVQFKGESNFWNAHFEGDAAFMATHFEGKTDFQLTEFNGAAVFPVVKFKGVARFDGAQFFDAVDFKNAQFDRETIFSVMDIYDYIDFSKSKVSVRLCFENITSLKTSFIDVDLSNVDFIRCGWPKKQSKFLKHKWFGQFKRNVLYDEILCEQKRAHSLNVEKPDLLDLQKNDDGYEDVEKLYQQMKEKYRGNEPEVSNWHYGQREMHRKKSKLRRYNPLSFSNLYWAFSGYGERPVRAGIALIIFLVVITLLMDLLGIVPANGKPINGILKINWFLWELDFQELKYLCFTTIQNLFFVKDPYFVPMTKYGEALLLITTKALIPIQAALFGFALRNKFRR